MLQRYGFINPRRLSACLRRLAFGFVFIGLQHAQAGQKVWIFAGEPGNQEYHQRYEKNLGDLRSAFTSVYHLSPEDVHVFYGPKEAGYDGPCTKQVLLAELGKASAATHSGSDPVWVILIGHANVIPGGVMFNIPGPDATPGEMAEALKDASADTPLIFISATTASQYLIRSLAAPGRMIITADAPKDPDSEPDFPLALAAALADRQSDTNQDGLLSVTELFLQTRRHLDEMYRAGGYMVREHAQLDGNGDGKGTTRPAAIDADPASQVGLRTDLQPSKKYD